MNSKITALPHLFIPRTRASALKKPKRKPGGFPHYSQEEMEDYSEKLIDGLRTSIELDNTTIDLRSFVLRLTTKDELNATFFRQKLHALNLQWLNPTSSHTLIVALPKDKKEDFEKKIIEYGKSGALHSYLDDILKIDSISPTDRISTNVAVKKQQEEVKVDFNFYSGMNLEDYEKSIDYIRKEVGKDNILYRKTDDPQIPFIRVSTNVEVVKKIVASVPSIRKAEVVPSTITTVSSNKDVSEVTFEPASDSLSVIMVIDCGVNHDHPGIKNVLIMRKNYLNESTAEGVSTQDQDGHGTRVAGLAAYGMLSDSSLKRLTPSSKIGVAKIHDGFDNTPFEGILEKIIVDSLTHNIRIFSLTVMFEKPATEEVSRLAYTIDTLSRKYDVLFVISAGNILNYSIDEFSKLGLKYPEYFTHPNSRIFEGGEACCAITVGGIAQTENSNSIARKYQASPFTRSGPTSDGRLKPDLVHFAGNLTRSLDFSDDLGVVSLNNHLSNGLFSVGSGTSFSTPIVANLASQILQNYPKATANLIRALLIHSAEVKDEHRDIKEPRFVYGFGFPEKSSAIHSTRFSPTLIFEGEVMPDEMIDLLIPVPKEMSRSKGSKFMKITLSYDPPVSAQDQQLNYCNLDLTFKILRKSKSGGHTKISGNNKMWMTPYYRQIENNSVKKDTLQWEKKHCGEDWIIRITPTIRGDKSLVSKQKFALIVTIEDSRKEIDLYSPLEELFKEETQKVLVPTIRPQSRRK